MQLVDGRGRLLNHLEVVYRPGEKEAAQRAFEALGCKVKEFGKFLACAVDPAVPDYSDTVVYASQVTRKQWAFEEKLMAAVGEPGELADTWADYAEQLRTVPQRSFHFGIRFASLEDWEAAVERVRAAGDDAELKGRIEVAAVFRPGDPGSVSDSVAQAFVSTDVFAAGLLTFPQHIELQHQFKPAL